ncbi:hypothetical protein LZP96_13255 [Enterobacteriaceae bacterium 155047]|uniref:hypothetical protein n=1 Tax=Huaxiibacter chinensis TaxID=2899785 RepID=UPI0007DAA979|nr:hypothetical protein [Huaxiibacter chinensis]ANG94179.1 hypothetical protein A8A57_17925 [Lelliottia amnigena]MCG5044994.1 hypothetical protein [Huaxiibacter chinensis]
MQIKVIHVSFPYVGENRGGAEGDLMGAIVGVTGDPLNAHSCRCLAHFYRGLEKKRKSAHTVQVKYWARSQR